MIMDGDIKSNVMPVMPRVPGRVAPVQAVPKLKPEQSLPQGGTELPLREREASDDRVDEAVSNLNDYVQVIRRELEFRVDKDTGRTVVTVLDAETREVIRQIPREEVLALAKHLGTRKGLLFSSDI